MKVDYTAWFDNEPNNAGDGEGNFKKIELQFQLLLCFLLSFNCHFLMFKIMKDCVTFTYHADDQQNIDGKYWNDDGCFKEFSFICEAYDSDFHQEQDPWPTFGGWLVHKINMILFMII